MLLIVRVSVAQLFTVTVYSVKLVYEQLVPQQPDVAVILTVLVSVVYHCIPLPEITAEKKEVGKVTGAAVTVATYVSAQLEGDKFVQVFKV